MTKYQRMTLAKALLVVPMLVILAMPADAQGNMQISGTGVFDENEVCGDPPVGFENYTAFTIIFDGDLEGCLWTWPRYYHRHYRHRNYRYRYRPYFRLAECLPQLPVLYCELIVTR